MSPIGPTTVVIPVHNGAKYLAEAVESARRQTLGAARIVIIDDGSTDGTSEIAARFHDVTYARQQHAGVAAALNHGVRLATDGFISFLSADDVWCPDKLALQHAALGASPEGRLVFGHMQHFISPEIAEEVAVRLYCPAEPMPAFSAGTMLATLDTVRAIGPFNENFKVGEFMDWYARARDLHREIVMLPDIVSMRRVHGANFSTEALRTKTYVPVLKALLDRRRGAK